MQGGQLRGKFSQQGLLVGSGQHDQSLTEPVRSRRQEQPFAAHQDLQTSIGVEPELAAKALAAGETQQDPLLTNPVEQQVVDRVIIRIRGNAVDAGIRAAADGLGLTPHTRRLRQHLKTFAIDGGLGIGRLAIKQ